VMRYELRIQRLRRLVSCPLIAATLCGVTLLTAAPAARQDQWAKEMAAFEAQDSKAPPPPGGIVFVGSSSIRLWDLEHSFPALPVINRGFGGSQIADSVRNVDRLVIRHKPRTVVFYAGDNDIAAGKSPTVVANDFKRFAARVHAALPRTRIAFIGIKPSIQRWQLVGQVREANALILAYCQTDDRLGFIDVDGPMLGWDEKPRKNLLAADGLHLTAKGYELWTALVAPFVE
jgi:lysophospholipase L1-like esterase